MKYIHQDIIKKNDYSFLFIDLNAPYINKFWKNFDHPIDLKKYLSYDEIQENPVLLELFGRSGNDSSNEEEYKSD